MTKEIDLPIIVEEINKTGNLPDFEIEAKVIDILVDERKRINKSQNMASAYEAMTKSKPLDGSLGQAFLHSCLIEANKIIYRELKRKRND